jgi:hypothetical protein
MFKSGQFGAVIACVLGVDKLREWIIVIVHPKHPDGEATLKRGSDLSDI